jgi:hypothetical protein
LPLAFLFFFFFDKEYILISQRYQLHPASATTQCPKDLRMHTALKQMEEQEENNNKERSRYCDLFLVDALQPLSRQQQKSKFSKSDAFKKETVHKRHRRPIIDHRFSPWRKPVLSKQCLQQDHCQTQPIKAIPWIFTLKDKTLYFFCVVAPTCLCRCYKS